MESAEHGALGRSWRESGPEPAARRVNAAGAGTAAEDAARRLESKPVGLVRPPSHSPSTNRRAAFFRLGQDEAALGRGAAYRRRSRPRRAMAGLRPGARRIRRSTRLSAAPGEPGRAVLRLSSAWRQSLIRGGTPSYSAGTPLRSRGLPTLSDPRSRGGCARRHKPLGARQAEGAEQPGAPNPPSTRSLSRCSARCARPHPGSRADAQQSASARAHRAEGCSLPVLKTGWAIKPLLPELKPRGVASI